MFLFWILCLEFLVIHSLIKKGVLFLTHLYIEYEKNELISNSTLIHCI